MDYESGSWGRGILLGFGNKNGMRNFSFHCLMNELISMHGIPMQLQPRQITGYLYLAFAAIFAVGQSLALFLAIVGVQGRPWAASSIVINFVLTVAAAVAGLALLKDRARARPWLWLAVFVAGLGLFRTNLWELFLVGHIGPLGLQPFNFSGSLWRMLMGFAGHFMLPVMFFLSVVLLFQKTPVSLPPVSTPAAAATPVVLPPGFTAVPVPRRSSLFGVLSLVFFGVGIPIVCVMATLTLTEGPGDTGAILQLVSLLAFLCGFICVMVAFIRWEKRLVFPLLGYTASVTPLMVLAFRFSGGVSAMLIFGVLFCAACVIASMKTRERGRNWSLLAAIPAGFAVLALVQPVLNFLFVR
jgi:hypothetical protein